MDSAVLSRVRLAMSRHPLLVDVLLGGLVAAPILLGRTAQEGLPLPPISVHWWVTAAVWATVALRRVNTPAALLAAAALTVVTTMTSGSTQPFVVVALVVLLYTYAAAAQRPAPVLVLPVVAAAIYLPAALTEPSWWSPQNLAPLAWLGMATAFGDATRSRQAYVAEMEERARRAEQTRGQEVRRRVVQERMRIARELHDVVTHHIAVINVQAGAARHVLRRQPEIADAAMEHVRRASDTVLRELASVVGVLRQDGDLENRGLAQLPELLEGATSSGLRVEHEENGTRQDLPAVVDLAAYRILQEALTNARRHGVGPARVSVGYTPSHVVLEVTNQIGWSGAAAHAGGYGLIGMRERAAAAGGTLSAQSDSEDLFRVRAVLPVTGVAG